MFTVCGWELAIESAKARAEAEAETNRYNKIILKNEIEILRFLLSKQMPNLSRAQTLPKMPFNLIIGSAWTRLRQLEIYAGRLV